MIDFKNFCDLSNQLGKPITYLFVLLNLWFEVMLVGGFIVDNYIIRNWDMGFFQGIISPPVAFYIVIDKLSLYLVSLYPIQKLIFC